MAFALRDGFDALTATGARFDGLIAIGGGTRSLYWLRMIATVLGVPLHLPAGEEFGAALGAARLAICAATSADPQEVMEGPTLGRQIDRWQSSRALRGWLCPFPRRLSADRQAQ
ncbi:MAG: FGGY-family carbohydrate kinase [Defluviimonas denitrificans]